MWFAKWFGGGRGDESEPSEHPPHPVAMRAQKATPAVGHPSHSKKAPPPKIGAKKGFDPYNSGSFDRHKAWSRVIR